MILLKLFAFQFMLLFRMNMYGLHQGVIRVQPIYLKQVSFFSPHDDLFISFNSASQFLFHVKWKLKMLKEQQISVFNCYYLLGISKQLKVIILPFWSISQKYWFGSHLFRNVGQNFKHDKWRMFSIFTLCPMQSSLQEGMKCVWAVWCCRFAITLGQHYVIVSPNYDLWESRLNSFWLIFHVFFSGSNELPNCFPHRQCPDNLLLHFESSSPTPRCCFPSELLQRSGRELSVNWCMQMQAVKLG